MLLYIARRLVWTLVVVLAVLRSRSLVFYMLPAGDPALRFAGKSPTPEALAADPAPARPRPAVVRRSSASSSRTSSPATQYGWPGPRLLVRQRVSVLDEITQRAPRTLFLIVGAATIWLVLGVSIGVLSAVKRRTVADRAAMGFALFGISAPVFWLGLMALFIFWQKLRPDRRHGLRRRSARSSGGLFSHMILPWIVPRAPLRGDLRPRDAQQPARDARRGLHPHRARQGPAPSGRVIFKHGLRASLTPIVTMFGLDIALLVGGAIITESVFNIQGLGWLAINSGAQPGSADRARRDDARRPSRSRS